METQLSTPTVEVRITQKLNCCICYCSVFISIKHLLLVSFPFQRLRVIIDIIWTTLLNQHSTYTSMIILLSVIFNVGMDCIILVVVSLINSQLTLLHSYLLLKTTNNILFDIKLKERIELVTYKGKLAGLPCNTTKTSLPTTKSSTPELLMMTSTGMKPSMDQESPS